MKERIYGIIGCLMDVGIQMYLSVADLFKKKRTDTIEDPTIDSFR